MYFFHLLTTTYLRYAIFLQQEPLAMITIGHYHLTENMIAQKTGNCALLLHRAMNSVDKNGMEILLCKSIDGIQRELIEGKGALLPSAAH